MFRADGEGIRQVATDIRIGDHRITVDEPPTLGGEDTDPNPVETVLAGLLSCQVVTLLAEQRRGAAEFGRAAGGVVLLVDPDGPVAGGAFRRHDPVTAELKRIWTAARYRRRGPARHTLATLEREIAARGYRRIFLTTGPRQPEAVGLYRAAGYTPGFDESLPAEEVGIHAFTKELPGDSATAEPG